jgi:hypothetical protein
MSGKNFRVETLILTYRDTSYLLVTISRLNITPNIYVDSITNKYTLPYILKLTDLECLPAITERTLIAERDPNVDDFRPVKNKVPLTEENDQFQISGT